MKKIVLISTFFLLFFFGFVKAQNHNVSVTIQDPLPVCNSGDYVDLTATYDVVETTTDYRVESIPYNPIDPFIGGLLLPRSRDDSWSKPFTLPFNFCFYGQYYNVVYVGSNGVITFDVDQSNNFTYVTVTDISDPMYPGYYRSPYQVAGGPLPSATFDIKNAVFGVYQDTNLQAGIATEPTDVTIQNVNYYVTGTAPNRKFIANFNELALYGSSCGPGYPGGNTQTSQIVLYETSNVIEVNIKRRNACTGWNGGKGVVGVINRTGLLARVPGGRNVGAWSTTNEAWRFVPDGNTITSEISWLEDGVAIPGSTGLSTISINPTQDVEYTAVVQYTQCDNTINTISDVITVGPEPFVLFNEPEDIRICVTGSGPYSFNLDQDALMLNLADPSNAQDPSNFYITYHASEADAIAGFPSINPGTNPGELSNYLSNGGETIWVAVQDFWTNGCIQYRSFDLLVQADPSGDIAYTGSPYCTSDTNTYLPSTNTVVPLNGNFEATPPGLSIDATTGEITPATSAVGTYSVKYKIPVTSTCPPYETPPVEIIIQDCSSCSLALDTNFGPASQTICLGNSIADIVYNYGGDATSFDLQFTPNLPAGLSVNIVGSQLTITGTPTETGTFNYGISTLGCISNIGPLTGSIIINNMPAVPTINTIAATCTSDGVSTITNYTSGLTYVFTPSGPSVDATGLISGMTPGTSYTVVADNGSCSSSSSVSFTNDAMLTTPAVPTVSSVAADCSSDEISSISNYDGSVTYIFTPSGPSVDATGLISGMVVGTSYTVYADNGSCSSVASSSFTNDAMLATPAVPTINTIAATCTSDGVSTITNYTSGLTYVFTPSGPSVDATGLISGMTPGTSYTVVADNGSCSSSSSVSFTNDAMLTTPAVPTVSSVAADCSSDEISSISNYDGSVTYIFTPSGPSVDATGLISGMVVGTSYTVYADNGSCSSVASSSFTNDAMLATPAVPTINTIAATCTSDGVSTITNYTSGLTYVFTPSGPSVDATGLISGMTPGTSYTVVADNGSCSSSSSVSFTNDAMLTTPAVPTVSSVAADCSSDEISSISNYDGSVTYIFTPSGPSVDATGLISGMVVGTSYTVYADNGSCSSVASSSFTNDAMLATPAVPTINTIAATCTSDGVSTITNYTSGLTYVFTPSGPSVDATGLISGMTPGTSYTVVADNGSCSSSSSVSFTNDAMLTTPAVPTVSSVAADCSSDEISSISNYDGSVTYIFTPSGPSVDATGLISGMVVGTSYTVYADNGSCSSVASSSFTNDAMLATPAVPTINTIAATCTSDGVSTITNYTSGLTYVFTPSGPSVDATGLISGMTPGTSYTVVADNGSCSSSSSVSFTNDAMLTTPAVPTVSSVAADCSSDEISSISNYDGSVTYIFTPSGPSVDATGLISGMVVGTSYTVYADNGSCSSVASSSFTNDAMLATPAVPTINTIAATCTSDGVSTITNYTSGLTYVFTPSGPSVDATGLISGMTPGTSYTVVADNGSCSSSSSVSFTNDAMLTLPVVPIINTITESCSSDGISTVTNFVSGLTYIFTPVGPSVQANGEITNMIYGVTYTVYADNGSCSSSNSSSFMINQMLPTPSIVVTNNSPSICDGDMTNIVVTGLQTGETLNWIVNANEVNGLISGQGTSFTDAILTLFSGIETPRVVNIRFYADNGSCTSSFHDIDVTVNPRPDIMVSPNTPEEQTICSGETTNIEISSTYPNVTFSWEVISNVNGVVGASNGTGDTIAQTLSVSGTLQGVVVYRLHAFIGSCESANTIDFTVYVNPKPVYNPIITPTAICDGASINLNYSHPDTNITFGWDLVLTNADVVGGILSGVTTTNSLNLNQAFTLVDSLVSGQATFTVWVDLNGCKSDPFTATVDIHPNPQVQLQDGAICVQDGQVYQTYWLNAGVLPLGGDYEYEWFMVDTAGDISLGTTTTPYYEVVMAGDYYVVVTNVDVLLGTNCSGVSNTVTVIETNPATLANATAVVTEFFTGSGVVTITVTDGNGTLEYQLDEGEFQSSNVFTGVSAGPHTVTVVDTQGCTYFTIPVLVVDYPKFFTPNGDGYNDTWNIIGLEQENAKLYIFDRYGKLIKQINTLGANQGNGWDGTLNGKPLPSTDYWFSLEYEENGIMKEFKAHFSLKR